MKEKTDKHERYFILFVHFPLIESEAHFSIRFSIISPM